VKEVTLTKAEIAKKAAIFTLLIGIAILTPAIVHRQEITGPIINAILFLSTVLLSPELAMFIGLFPSIVALSSGLLPAVLAPMVPFIMTANAILVLIFSFLRKKSYWLGVVLAAFCKFLFLFSTSSIMMKLILKKELATKVAAMMGWTQLVTALAGGIIAFLILKALKKI
ncbi:MAG: ECF transporter S component, partial [Patescibacteria group bacterium]